MSIMQVILVCTLFPYTVVWASGSDESTMMSGEALKPERSLKFVTMLSKNLFTFIDEDLNGKVNREELDFLKSQPFNGLHLHSDKNIDKLFKAMDKNGDDNLVESEFTNFKHWMFEFFDASSTKKISLGKIRKYRSGDDPLFVFLDRDEDGFIDTKDLTL